jgi:dihydroflavonol-4-reductase
MKVFITGGAGFIGSHVIRKLVARGDQVNALVRTQKGAALLTEMGARPMWGDITALESLREGMRHCDMVFHLAAWYRLGASDWQKAERINVDGTRNVLTLAYTLGIPRILYTSTLAVYGDTHGQMVDESYIPPAGPFLTEYDRTKYLAHYQVALPLIEQGAPILILMPGAVYGPGDNSLVGQMMGYFYQGLFPVLPGPELTLTYAHVDDIAEGHLLAADKGRPGESYHLTGPAMPMSEAIRLWSQVSGQRPPFFSISGHALKRLAPLVGKINQVVHLPEVISQDTLAILDASYLGSAEKARSELGWQARPPAEGFRETFEWIAGESRPIPILSSRTTRRQWAAIALGAGVGALAAWMLYQRKKSQ